MNHYTNSTRVRVPTLITQKSRGTPFLKKTTTLLKENRTTMDQLARTPVTAQDLLANAIVTPVG